MTTTIHVQTTTYGNGSNFNDRNNNVSPGNKIDLNAAGNSNIDVYTYLYKGSSWQLADVFKDSSAPYKAKPDGNTYTLKSSISETTIVLSLSSSPPVMGANTSGTNGTINVGGGNNGGGDDDHDDGDGDGDDDGNGNG